MKTYFYPFIFLGLVFTGYQCAPDPCSDLNCGSWGDCMEGTCLCQPGYETDASGACNTAVRSKFLGSWKVMDNCSITGTQNYTAGTAENSGNINYINIQHLWLGFNNPVIASIASDSLLIHRQEPDGTGFFVEGHGLYVVLAGDTTLQIDYKVTSEADPANPVTDNCSGSIWLKQ